MINKKKYKTFIFSFLVLLTLSSCFDDTKKKARISQIQKSNEEVFEEGQKAPSIRLRSLLGKESDLSEWYDSSIVLNFWATWCVPCVKELPMLETFHSEMKDKGIKVVTINVDPEGSEGEVRKLVTQLDLSFPVLLDPELFSVEKFRISGFPETFFIRQGGYFAAIYDPITGEQSVRIMGDREWVSQDIKKSIIEEFEK